MGQGGASTPPPSNRFPLFPPVVHVCLFVVIDTYFKRFDCSHSSTFTRKTIACDHTKASLNIPSPRPNQKPFVHEAQKKANRANLLAHARMHTSALTLTKSTSNWFSVCPPAQVLKYSRITRRRIHSSSCAEYAEHTTRHAVDFLCCNKLPNKLSWRFEPRRICGPRPPAAPPTGRETGSTPASSPPSTGAARPSRSPSWLAPSPDSCRSGGSTCNNTAKFESRAQSSPTSFLFFVFFPLVPIYCRFV